MLIGQIPLSEAKYLRMLAKRLPFGVRDEALSSGTVFTNAMREPNDLLSCVCFGDDLLIVIPKRSWRHYKGSMACWATPFYE